MKIFMFFLITLVTVEFLLSSLVRAQAEHPPLFIGPEEQIQKPERVRFKGHKVSRIPWSKLAPDEFLDFSLWKKAAALKEREPNWQRNIIEREMREFVGRVLECVGSCRVYRGLGFANVNYKSAIREGDEIITMANSYLWVYLFDGTLLRLSPESSVSFKELNIGLKENFLHARIDSGNVLWLSRYSHKFEVQKHKETDTIFLPLDYFEANLKTKRPVIDEDNLFSLLEEDQGTQFKYERLNRLIEENNETIFKKPTYSYLVFHNGTVFGKNLSAEFIVLIGDKSYLKLRGQKQLKLQGGIDFSKAIFYFRGFENRDERELELDRWYEIGEKGRQVSEYEQKQRFSVGEFLTSNIPTIFIARELMAKRYSPFAHDSMTSKELALNFGYRQWTSIEEGSDGDLERRVAYLKEYTRRSETMNLLVGEQFRRKLKKRGESLKKYTYGPHFYSRAIHDYYTFRNSNQNFNGQKEELNSTLKPFWKKIHGIR